MVVNSPLITGRTLEIKNAELLNSPGISPLSNKRNVNKVSDMHRQVLLKTVKCEGYPNPVKKSDEELDEGTESLQKNLKNLEPSQKKSMESNSTKNAENIKNKLKFLN